MWEIIYIIWQTIGPKANPTETKLLVRTEKEQLEFIQELKSPSKAHLKAKCRYADGNHGQYVCGWRGSDNGVRIAEKIEEYLLDEDFENDHPTKRILNDPAHKFDIKQSPNNDFEQILTIHTDTDKVSWTI